MRTLRMCSLWRLSLFTLLALCAMLGAVAKDINLLGYTAGGTLPAAYPSPANLQQDVRAQLQAAIDDAASDGGGTITIPGDYNCWYIGKPVFIDKPNITIAGDGAPSFQSSATMLSSMGVDGGHASVPLFVVGTPRQTSGLEITPSHRTDLYGTLDTSIPANTYFGLKTKGRNKANTADVYAHGYFSNCGASVGPRNSYNRNNVVMGWLCPVEPVYQYDINNGQYDWSAIVPYPQNYQLTFDIAIKQNTAGTLTGTICGDGMANDMTHPQTYWMLGTFPGDADPNTVKFKFKTGNPDTGVYTIRTLTLGTITDTNVHRITVQLDMGGTTGPGQPVNPQAAAWLDGVQTSTLTLPAIGSWQAVPNYNQNVPGTYHDGQGNPVQYLFNITNPENQLWRYEQGAFQLGSLHAGMLGDPAATPGVTTQQHVDWTYCGFMMTSALRYTWAPTLTRLDNGQSWPQNNWDGWRYFTYWLPQMECYLQLTDNPQGTDCDNIGTVCSIYNNCGANQGFGYWVPERGPYLAGDGKYGVNNLTIQDVLLKAHLAMGEVRSLLLSGVVLWGGGAYDIDDYNCGVINNGVLPTITDYGLCLSGTGGPFAHLYLANKNINSNENYFGSTTFAPFRLVGCQGTFKYSFGNIGGDRCDYYWKSYAGIEGGSLTIDNPALDNEWSVFPNKAVIYHEFSPLVNGVTRETNTLNLLDVFASMSDATKPVVELANVGQGTLNYQRNGAWPVNEPFYNMVAVTNSNPNAYGAVNVTVPTIGKWIGQGLQCGYPYSGGTVVYNEDDGQYYRGRAICHPGDIYTTCTQNGTFYRVHEDNRPLAGEPWKTYWKRANFWALSTSYAVNDLCVYVTNGLSTIYQCTQAHTSAYSNMPGTTVGQSYWTTLFAPWNSSTNYSVGNMVTFTYMPWGYGAGAYYMCLFKCIQANTNQSPNIDGTSNAYWQSLQWDYSTAYTAGGYVACDSAIYQCLQTHTSGAYTYTIPVTHEPTRPRPWDLIPAGNITWINYTGTGSNKIISTHMELSKLPPTSGQWNANEPVIYHPAPLTVNAPSEYRNPLGGAPGTWRADNTLGTFVTP